MLFYSQTFLFLRPLTCLDLTLSTDDFSLFKCQEGVCKMCKQMNKYGLVVYFETSSYIYSTLIANKSSISD